MLYLSYTFWNLSLLSDMDQSTLFDIYNIIRDDKLSFVYQGEFSDDMTEMITSLSEFNMSKADEVTKLKKKVFFLMVESFQNIVRHGEKTKVSLNKTADKAGIFLTRNINNTYYITSANLFKNDQVEGMIQKLKNVNSLDEHQLKALYLDILSNDGLSSKGGAGLGLIEMARKSGQELEFEFEKVNEEYSFFYLQIKIPNPTASEAIDVDSSKISIDVAKEFHKKMLDGDVLMVHHGDFSQGSILPLLQLIEDNLSHQFEGTLLKKQISLILIEMLQNISKHGKEQNGIASGIFLMGKEDDRYVFGAGNMIDNENIPKIKERIDNLNGMGKEDLSKLYKQTLRSGTPTVKGGAGLGLIEIARESHENLLYEFTPVNDSTSFFSLIAAL